jgi:hypothetical protein
MANGNYDAEWFRKAWPLLLLRWAVFATLIGLVTLARGESIAAAALIGVFVGAVLNAAWQMVA